MVKNFKSPGTSKRIHFYVYKGGSGAHTAMAIDTSDTNGQCVTYYWDTDNDGDYNIENNVPYLSYDFGKLESEISVWAADEDGIMSEKVTFYLYPDDPPLEVEASVVPADLNPTTKYTFSWSGMDVKDQTLTEYRILVHQGGIDGYNSPDSANIADIAKDWTPGTASEFNENGGSFSWEYIPTGCESGTTCRYYWQVEARDARGTIVRGEYSYGFLNFTAP